MPCLLSSTLRMLERIEGILMETVKHNDSYNVVTLYTRRRGRMAFLVPVGKSKAGKMRNAILSPMAVVSADINFRQGKELYTLRQPQPVRLWHCIYSNPVKGALLYFLSEFCSKLIRQYPADENLWRYIMEALETLETMPASQVANFHIAFLVRLLPVVGIEPNIVGYEEGDVFDMISAEMVAKERHSFTRRMALLSDEESRLLPVLMRISYRSMSLYRFTREERRRVLDGILRYYSLHLPIGTDYKTLTVLRDLFD